MKKTSHRILRFKRAAQPSHRRASRVLKGAVRMGLVIAVLAAWHLSSSPTAYRKPVIDVGIVVSDLERSLAFYEDALGMQHVGSVDVPGEIANAAGLTDGRLFRIETLQLADGPDATEWKLVQVEGARRAAASYIHDGTGLQYVTMHVQALAPLLARLVEHGIQPPADHPLDLGNGHHFALVRDPDGIFIELVGPLHATE